MIRLWLLCYLFRAEKEKFADSLPPQKPYKRKRYHPSHRERSRFSSFSSSDFLSLFSLSVLVSRRRSLKLLSFQFLSFSRIPGLSCPPAIRAKKEEEEESAIIIRGRRRWQNLPQKRRRKYKGKKLWRIKVKGRGGECVGRGLFLLFL